MGKKTNMWVNNLTFINAYNSLRALTMNSIRWEGDFPMDIDPAYVERSLFYHSMCAFFYSEEMGKYAILRCSAVGKPDIYNNPVVVEAYGANGFSIRLHPMVDCVIIKDNYNQVPLFMLCEEYARKLYTIERSRDINIYTSKYPGIIVTDKDQVTSVKNMIQNYDENQALVVADTTFNNISLKSMDFAAPYMSDKLSTLKHIVLNEYLSLIGIENSNQDKKERLIADEIGANYGLVEAARNVRLNARQYACQQIKRLYNLNISVKFNSDVKTLVNGGDNNGALYDNGTKDLREPKP